MNEQEIRDALRVAMESSARGNTYAQWADTILPVVRRIVAAELRASADIPLKACCPEHASKRLRARAREMDPA